MVSRMPPPMYGPMYWRNSGGMLPVFSMMRWNSLCSIGPIRSVMGMERTSHTNAPTTPANRPTTAPSPGVIAIGWFCWRT